MQEEKRITQTNSESATSDNSGETSANDDVQAYNDWGASEAEFVSHGWTVEYSTDRAEGFSKDVD